MLYQLHHQFKDGHTEMQAQREITNNKEMGEWLQEIQTSHPLPKNASWLRCEEKSEFFAGMKI